MVGGSTRLAGQCSMRAAVQTQQLGAACRCRGVCWMRHTAAHRAQRGVVPLKAAAALLDDEHAAWQDEGRGKTVAPLACLSCNWQQPAAPADIAGFQSSLQHLCGARDPHSCSAAECPPASPPATCCRHT